jgi:hypothetical protein
VSDRLRLPLRFDAPAMRADVAALEESAWIDHYVKDNYEGAWTVLPLRSAAGARHPIATIYSDPSASGFEDTPLLARCAYLPAVLAAFACPLHAVRLMRLAAGSVIKPHSDHDLAAEYGRARLHVPVVTNPDVEFVLDGERVVLGEGECWYLDLSRVHAVANRGETDRIHLVIDVVVNEWLTGQLAHAARSEPGPRAGCLVGQPQVAPPTSDLERLRAAVWEDSSLQHRLQQAAGHDAFIVLVLKVASERGWATTSAEIENAMRTNRRRVRQTV